MLYLDRNHDPKKNQALLSSIFGKDIDLSLAVNETKQLFRQWLDGDQEYHLFTKSNVSIFRRIASVLFFPFRKHTGHNQIPNLVVDQEGNVFPEWLPMLEKEFLRLQNKIKVVNVEEFGAVGDGKTDNTEAFKKAIGKGGVKVTIPPGTYITRGIRLPSWTFLSGAGKGKTTLKLHPDEDKGARLVTNANYRRGNHHLCVADMSLDWNVKRLGQVENTSTGDNHSSCLTYANATFGWVRNVEAINPGLHCFDISSIRYDYSGDGSRGRGGSRYIWLDRLNGFGFGDDGITTHHSDDIFISNSHMCDPSGLAHEKGSSNSNGFEVDDGSRNITLFNNSSARCFGGVEIKAHEDSSAAANVQIVGHLSVNDNRSFNFRHIGHHKAADPESKTAFNIMATQMAAIAPIRTALYKDSSPRGLVVSAYKNVVINHFALIGDREYDYRGEPVIAIQYRARKVALNNLLFRNFKKAGADIKIFGGSQRADMVKIKNADMIDSAPKTVDIGKGVEQVTLETINQQ